MAKQFDLFLLSASTLDNVILMDGKFPIEAGVLLSARDCFLEPGGEANLHIMLNRLGGKPLPVGPIGTDHYAQFLLNVFKEENIESSGLKVIEGYRNPIANSIVDENGHHSFVAFYQGMECDTRENITEKLLQCRAYYLSGYLLPDGHPLHELALEMMYEAKKHDIPVFYDPGPQVAVLSREMIDEILDNVDVVCLNDEEAGILTGRNSFEEMVEDIRGRTQALIVYKSGGKGSCVFSREMEPVWYPSFKVEVKDTMGCGDCFLAAFIHVYLRDGDLDKAMTIANATGAATAAKFGTGRQVPLKKEIISLLKNNGYVFDDEEDILSIRTKSDL